MGLIFASNTPASPIHLHGMRHATMMWPVPRPCVPWPVVEGWLAGCGINMHTILTWWVIPLLAAGVSISSYSVSYSVVVRIRQAMG